MRLTTPILAIIACAFAGCSSTGRGESRTILVGEMNGQPLNAEIVTESSTTQKTGPDAAQIKAAASMAADAAVSAMKDQLTALVPGLPALTGALESVMDKGVAKMYAAKPTQAVGDAATLGTGAVGLALLAAREFASARARKRSEHELQEAAAQKTALELAKKDLESQRSDLILGNERALATLDKDKRKAFLGEMERNHSENTRRAVWDLTP